MTGAVFTDGAYWYGWDLAADGAECCVVCEILEDGTIYIVEVVNNQIEERKP